MDPAAFQAFLSKLTAPITATAGQTTNDASGAGAAPVGMSATATSAAAAAPAPASTSSSLHMPPPAALPAASINLTALSSPAPRGMVARTLVRIRRARRLGAPDSAAPRAMYVTRISSSMQTQPLQDDEQEEEEEQQDVDQAPMATRSMPAPMPAPSSSPYRYGIATPSPPSRAHQDRPASDDESGGDEDEDAESKHHSGVGSGRPQHLRARPAPKRHHDQMDNSESSDDERTPQSAAAATAQAEAEAEGDESMADDDGSADGRPDNAPPSTNPNMSKRKKEWSTVQLNRSGCRSFNEFLRRIEFRTPDMHDLTVDEFLSVLPRWVTDSRMGNGAPYVWATIKGYINALQRVVRTFEPSSEWAHLTLKDIPSVRKAILELQAREPQDTKPVALPSPAGTPTPIAITTGEMTTRRAQRIANGEVLPLRENYSYSPPSSAPNSPRLSGQAGGGGGGDMDPSSGSATSGFGRGRTSAVQKLSPEQEAYMVAQLDPQHPEGLFRLNFINVAKHFGITYTEEHRSLTLRNLLRGSKVLKVRYEGGVKPRGYVDPYLKAAEEQPAATAAQSTDSTAANVAAATAASSSSTATSAAAATPSADAMDTSGDNSVAAAAADSPAVAAPSSAMSDVPAAAAAAAAPLSSAAPNPDAPSASYATNADAPAADDNVVYADDDTPFEVVDQSDSSPSVCWRRVRFVAFVPGPLQKRPLSFMYERPWEGALCPVRIYESYLAHRPPVLTTQVPGLTAADVELSYVLWLKCKKHYGPFELEWFLLAQIGRNKISSLISALATGLGFSAGFCNSSIAHVPKRAIHLTAEELDLLREENEKHLYGVPTKEENAMTQQVLMEAAAAEQMQQHQQQPAVPNNTAQEPESHAPFQTPSVPSKPQRTKADTAGHSQHSAPAPPPMQLDFSALLQQHSQSPLPYPPMAPFMPFMQAPNVQPPTTAASKRSFFPSQLDPSGDHLERNRQALQLIDDANQRQQLQRRQQQQQQQQHRPDVAPLMSSHHLSAPGASSLSHASSSLLSPFSYPPLMPSATTSAPHLPVAPPSMSLAPASIESVPSLMRFIDKFQTQLTTLSSYAAECQKSLDTLRGLSAQLKVESSAALKVQQQAAKIAQQFQQIEEQKFLIEQLRAEKSGTTPPTAGATAQEAQTAAAGPASSAHPAPAADPPSLPAPPAIHVASAAASSTPSSSSAPVAASSSSAPPVAENQPGESQPNGTDATIEERKEGARKEDAQAAPMQLDQGDEADDDDDLPPLVAADTPQQASSAAAAAATASQPSSGASAAAVAPAPAPASPSLDPTPPKHAASPRSRFQDTTVWQ